MGMIKGRTKALSRRGEEGRRGREVTHGHELVAGGLVRINKADHPEGLLGRELEVPLLCLLHWDQLPPVLEEPRGKETMKS